MKKLIFITVFCLAFSAQSIETKKLTYSVQGVEHHGYLALPSKSGGPYPAVLVVHEWWGLNDYAKRRANMLAELGYAALALDMFGEGKNTEHPRVANEFAKAATADMDLAEKKFRAALELLGEQKQVDAQRIAAVGYCFGGSTVLNMARRGVPLRGVVSFHGSLATSTPARKSKLKAPILVFNGEDDPMVSKDSITAFNKEMKAAGAKFQVIHYKGAKHGFTNPRATAKGKKFELPLAYDAKADKDSWRRMQQFFSRHLAAADKKKKK